MSSSSSPTPAARRGVYGWVSRKPKTAFWVTMVAAIVVGIGLGAASASDQSSIDTANAKSAALREKLTAQRAETQRVQEQLKIVQAKAHDTAAALKTSNAALKRATAKAEVPKFIGTDFDDIASDETVDQLRWKVRRSSRPTSDATPGTVLSQRPAPGTVLKGGKTLTIVVARKPPPKPKQWVTIKTLSGASSTKTGEFHIPSGVKARLSYSMPQDGNNAITLYQAPSEYIDLLLNEIGPQQGTTRMYEPGTYYLEVAGAYTIQVQVFKRPS